MNAIIEGIRIVDVTILAAWEGQGCMVEWSCPAANVDAKRLLQVKQAGFRFRIDGDYCFIVSRLPYTTFE